MRTWYQIHVYQTVRSYVPKDMKHVCIISVSINFHIPLQYITYGQNAMEPPASSRTPTIATTTTATITTTASILTTTKSTTVTTPVSAIKPIAKAAPKVNCFMMYSLLYASKHYLLQNNNNFSVSLFVVSPTRGGGETKGSKRVFKTITISLSGRFTHVFVVSPTGGGGETKGSKCRPSVIRRKCKVKFKGHLRSNVKVYRQDSLVTNNSQPLNPIVTKLGSQMHLGNLHAMLPSVVTC